MRGAAKGTVRAARKYLARLSLSRFGTTSHAQFANELDRATRQLLTRLPKKARHWGRARKGLNIFLRSCLYTAYLRDAYKLGLAERFFEVPLDGITGDRLWRESGDSLPRWKTVQGLGKETSTQYQAAAATLAAQNGFARVHLDAIWWGKREDES
jgi:hypothetical protein